MHCHLFIFTLLTLTLLQVVHAVNQLDGGMNRPKGAVLSRVVGNHDDTSETHSECNMINIEDDNNTSSHRSPKRNRRSKRVRRSARISSTHDYKWPNGIVPYTMSNFTEKEIDTIRSAMKRFECTSCVRFVERTTQDDFVSIFQNGDGHCYSNIGRTGGQQHLGLGSGCVYKRGVLHELMHTLGFWHEHNRPDRDEHIEVYWDNIKPEVKANFAKKPSTIIDTLNTRYDYFSILHYSEKAFSRNNANTIAAKRLVSGTRTGLSDTDILRVNRLYSCPTVPVHCVLDIMNMLKKPVQRAQT